MRSYPCHSDALSNLIILVMVIGMVIGIKFLHCIPMAVVMIYEIWIMLCIAFSGFVAVAGGPINVEGFTGAIAFFH